MTSGLTSDWSPEVFSNLGLWGERIVFCNTRLMSQRNWFPAVWVWMGFLCSVCDPLGDVWCVMVTKRDCAIVLQLWHKHSTMMIKPAQNLNKFRSSPAQTMLSKCQLTPLSASSFSNVRVRKNVFYSNVNCADQKFI